ncbi:MAG: ABC transporter ATP-binding protein [Deltaproteobacteria bacterium]|nr:ABC transporter ATP-binding protein [Deltaproteobacteria bacterium]NNK85194.1 ABC transporter ATP-binding protein [Desulfobacterales bacterium]
MISVHNVTKDYTLGKTIVKALRGVSLNIEDGEFVCISGPSGCGKSTLLNLIGCLDRPTSGKVTIDNEDVGKLNKNQLAEIRNRKIGFIFQSFNLIPVLNVYENIEMVFMSWKDVTKKEINKRIKSLIEEVGLIDYLKHKPGELSGGQMQRISIARALVTKPKVVLADEPTANLDSKTSYKVLEIMLDLNKRHNTTFIFSTHDPIVSGYAKRNIDLFDGAIKSENL